MKRRIYTQDRATLDSDSYREGFLAGYESGAEAAIEYLGTGYFAEAYEDAFYPELPGPGLWAEEDYPYDNPARGTAYRIGYSDAF